MEDEYLAWSGRDPSSMFASLHEETRMQIPTVAQTPKNISRSYGSGMKLKLLTNM